MYFDPVIKDIFLIILMFDCSVWAGVGMNKLWKWINSKPIKEERSTPVYITKVIMGDKR